MRAGCWLSLSVLLSHWSVILVLFWAVVCVFKKNNLALTKFVGKLLGKTGGSAIKGIAKVDESAASESVPTGR